MNIKTIIKSIILIVFILLSCFLIYKRYINNGKKTNSNSDFTMEITTNNNELVNIMDNIYYYNVTAVLTTKSDNEPHSLEDALKSGLISMDEILEKMEVEDAAFDGGSKTYIPKDKAIVKKGTLVITKCNKLDTDNKNIIISDKSHIEDLCN